MRNYFVVVLSLLLLINFTPTNVFAATTPVITLDSYSFLGGRQATVTFTFAERPINFTSSDVTVENGVLSNFQVTSNPLVYTATFTASNGSTDATNTISIGPKNTMTTFTGLSGNPQDLAYDGTNMWVTDYDTGVSKVTPAGVVTTYTGTGNWPAGIAYDGTNMWTANYLSNSVSKITPGGVITNYPGTGGGPDGIAYDGTNMWTANYGSNSVSKITPGGVITTYSGTGANPRGIAFDGTNMWTSNYSGNSVSKITPGGVITTYSGTGGGPWDIAFDGTNMWTANLAGGGVTKVTPAGTMTTYGSISGLGIEYDGTNMWATNYTDSTLVKITPAGVISVYGTTGTNPHGIAYDGTNMWTANYSNASVSKTGSTLSASSPNYTVTIDSTAPVLSINSNVPTQTTINDVTLHFTSTEDCTPSSFAPEVSVGFAETHISSIVANQDSTAYLSGVQSGGTYSVRFQCSDPAGNSSNILQLGPFTVYTPHRSGGGMLFIPGYPKVETPPVVTPVTPTLPVVSDIQKITQNLKINSKGNDVKILQLFLVGQNKGPNAKALSTHGVTNIFGQLTKATLIEWQKNNGLKADGIFGLKTREKIKLLNL